MKRLYLVAALLWLGIALGRVHAAPPSYADLYADPGRAMPMQANWQLQPVTGQVGQVQPWKDIFAFTVGIDPRLMERLRWLGLNPGKNSALAPGLFNAQSGQTLFLSSAARSFCDGRWQVVRMDYVSASSINDTLQPGFKVWLVERKPGGRLRSTTAYGRIDSQGRWAVPPVTCDGLDPRYVDSPFAISYLSPDGGEQMASDLHIDKVYAQPGLRNAQGQWLPPVPPLDITTAQWMAYRKRIVTPGSSGTGLIDARGRMVIPFIFGNLPDATAQKRIQLCTSGGWDSQRHTDTSRVCRWQRLRGSHGGAALRPVKDVKTNRWGYQDAQGQWVIAPQFHEARQFRHGYAVVAGAFPEDWRPPGWQDDWPMIRKFHRVGRYWAAEALVRNASTDGQWAIRFGLMNDAGQWLAPAPQPTLHITVIFPPGGRSDHYAQMLAKHLPNLLGRNVQVDHKPPATLADYRLLTMEGGNAKVWLGAMMLPRGGIKGLHQGPLIDTLLQSLHPVTLLASEPLVLVIDSEKADTLGIHSTDDLLAYARAHPGSLRIATGDDGWIGHLAFGLLRSMSGVDMQRVVYKRMYPDSDVITKEHAVELLFAPANGVKVAIERGQLRVLGTTANPAHPQSYRGVQWPTLASNASLAGYTVYDHFSLWAPADSDSASNRILQEAVAQVLAKPEVRDYLRDIQAVGGGGPPEALLELEHQEYEHWMRALSSSTR
ncbi:tripartite tricarboxylate transporter substrate-binding protein [Comamonas testosteroni]